MICNKCGAQIEDNSTFCPYCGSAVTPQGAPNDYYAALQYQQPQQPQQQADNGSNGCAIAGFVLAFFFSIVGLILSIVGLAKADKEYGGNGKGLAIAGIVISSLDLVIRIIIFVVVLLPLFALL